MNRFLLAAALLVPGVAHAQNWFGNQAPAGSGTAVTATGGTTAQTLADWFLNVPSGIGSLAGQTAGSVAVTGGTINGTAIGATTPGTGAFTTLGATSGGTLSGTFAGTPTFTGSANFNGGNTFGGAATFNNSTTFNGANTVANGHSFGFADASATNAKFIASGNTLTFSGTDASGSALTVFSLPLHTAAPTLTVSIPFSFSQIFQSGTRVWSGSSAPNQALSGIFSSSPVSGYASDGGQPALNYFRVTSSTTGLGDYAFRFWEDQSGGMGGRATAIFTASNDAFVGYTPTAWTTGTAYALGQTVANGYNIMYVTTAGTSGATSPTCSSSATTCSDDVVSYKYAFTLAGSQTMVGLTASAGATVSWGGTSGNPIGQVYGLNSLATCSVAFTLYCVGYENDFGITAGKSAESRIGEQLVIQGGASVAGTVEDVGWRISNAGSGAPLQNIMTWSSQTSDTVVSTTGYGLQAYSQGGGTGLPVMMGGAGAIDMLEFAPSASGPFGAGFILRGPGSQILGNGDVQSNFALLHNTATGSSIDVSQYQVTAVAVHAAGGGTGWTCTNKWARGSDGSIVNITSVSGGAVTGISLVKGAFASTPVTPVTYTAEQPRTCGGTSTTGSPTVPSTFLVDETWAQTNGGAPVLTLGGTATVAMGSAVQLAMKTVGTLPTCNVGTKAQMFAVSDATAPTYNASLTGGGTVSIPVYCNGSAWTAH